MATNEATPDRKVLTDKEKSHSDLWIWGIYAALCFISIIESYSASSREIAQKGVFSPLFIHAGMLALGAVIVYVIQRFPYKNIRYINPFFAIFTVGLLVYVIFWGDNLNGAQRSFRLMGVSVQPSEMAKLSIVMIIAQITASTQEVGGVKTKGVVWSAIIVVIYGALMYKQGFTNTAILMAISMSMMLIGGVQLKKMLVVLAIYAIAGGGYYEWKQSSDRKEEVLQMQRDATNGTDRTKTRENRIARFKWNEDSCLSHPVYKSEYQQEQYAYMARAHGGVQGVGPGNSRECSRLPLAFSDYIYSIIVEELGLWGGILLLMLYLALLGRAGKIASRCSRAFPALLVMGMAVMITTQALFHMAINTGAMPVSGQPLPLISKGGSSILMISAAFGIMLSVSRYAIQNNKNKGKNGEGKLQGELQAANPTQL